MSWSGAAAKKTLPVDLKKITHSEVLDIPKDLLTPVIEASANEDDRREIMMHLRECLAEPSGKLWRRIHGGLVLTEALVKSGSPALISETAEGRHFDLVQKLSFLEEFENVDKRIQNSIRRKAEALRSEVVPLIQHASDNPISDKDAEECKETASTCSPAEASVCSESTAASTSWKTASGFGSDDVNAEDLKNELTDASKRVMILNNIVAVGHSDDTTSESECGEDASKAAVRYREPHRMTAKARNERSRQSGHSSSSDSDDSKREPVAKVPAHQVDLLGF